MESLPVDKVVDDCKWWRTIMMLTMVVWKMIVQRQCNETCLQVCFGWIFLIFISNLGRFPLVILLSIQNILNMIFRWGRTQGLSPHSVFGTLLYLCRRLSDPFLHILCLSQTGWANIFVSIAITTNLVKKRNIIFEDLRLTMNLAWFSVMIYFSGLINPQAVNKCVQ